MTSVPAVGAPPASPPATATVVWNESTKLVAAALDRASTACVTVGVVTPLAGYLLGAEGPGEAPLLLGAAAWLAAASALHLLALRVMGWLE